MKISKLVPAGAMVAAALSLQACSLAKLVSNLSPVDPVVPGVLGGERTAKASTINSKAIKALVATGAVKSTAALIWYNAQGLASGPVMIDANGRVIPASLDSNPSNDDGVAWNPSGMIPTVLAGANPSAQALAPTALAADSHTLVGLSQHLQLSSDFHWYDNQTGADLGPVSYDSSGNQITAGHDGQSANPATLVVASESGPATLAGTYTQDTDGLVTGVTRVWSSGTFDNGDAVTGLANLAYGGFGNFHNENGDIDISSQSNEDFISGMMFSGMDNPQSGTLEVGVFSAAVNKTSAATLAAKHKARYAGTAKVVEMTRKTDGTVLGMDTLFGSSEVAADFDNGTVEAEISYDYHPHSNPAATNTATIAMNDGQIVGTEFVGNTHFSVNQSNIAVTSQHGQLVGTFAGAEGNTAGGSLLGQVDATITQANGSLLNLETIYAGMFVAGQVCQNLACN